MKENASFQLHISSAYARAIRWLYFVLRFIYLLGHLPFRLQLFGSPSEIAVFCALPPFNWAFSEILFYYNLIYYNYRRKVKVITLHLLNIRLREIFKNVNILSNALRSSPHVSSKVPLKYARYFGTSYRKIGQVAHFDPCMPLC